MNAAGINASLALSINLVKNMQTTRLSGNTNVAKVTASHSCLQLRKYDICLIAFHGNRVYHAGLLTKGGIAQEFPVWTVIAGVSTAS